MGDERLAILAVELLINGDYPHVVQHRFCGLVRVVRVTRQPMGDQEVDLVARKDKARDPLGCGDQHLHRAHARRQRRGEKPTTAGGDNLDLRDRLAGCERIACHPASKGVGRPGSR
jgi:hypothetical protein